MYFWVDARAATNEQLGDSTMLRPKDFFEFKELKKKITKPTLLISCSDAKNEKALCSFDRYAGGIYQLIRANCEDVFELFDDVLILSAKFGLISGKRNCVPNYNLKMCSRKKPAEIEAFSAIHKKGALKLLREQAKKSSTLFVCMSNDYLAAFDAMVGDDPIKTVGLDNLYVSREHEGIGELRGRVKRVIDFVKSEQCIEDATYFRSGIANKNELGLVSGGCDVGISLARVSTTKQTELFSQLLEATKTQALFIDNGLITKIKKGLPLDHEGIFTEYEKIIFSLGLPKAQTQNISIVVPDSTDSTEEALSIVKQFKKRILALSKRCRVILPIHRCDDIGTHAFNMLKELNFSQNITIGVPCLQESNLDLALSIAQIERVLSVKHPKTKEKLVKSVHFFGMSDATYKGKLNPRLLVAKLNQIPAEQLSLDACRVTAIFGKTKNGVRKGSRWLNIIENASTATSRTDCVQTKEFNTHTFEKEQNDPQMKGLVLSKYDEMVKDSKSVFWFWDAMNFALIQANQAHLVKHFVAETEQGNFDVAESDDAQYYADIYLSDKVLREILFRAVKPLEWAIFAPFVKKQPFDKAAGRGVALETYFYTKRTEAQAAFVF